MTSTFGGYCIATSGLFVSQTSLTTTSHNLANVNTTGYSRQTTANADTTLTLAANNTLSSGAVTYSVERARNVLLDQTYRAENSSLSYWQTANSVFGSAQEALNETSATSSSGVDDDSTGIQDALNTFFTDWQSLATDTTSESTRKQLVDDSSDLISTLTSLDSSLANIQKTCATTVVNSVNTINDLASQVSDLNLQIQQSEADGNEASDLRDQRDYLVDQISSYTNVTTKEQADGTYSVYIGGVALVSGINTHTLTTSGSATAADPLTINWTDISAKVELNSGSLKANLENANPTSATETTNITNSIINADGSFNSAYNFSSEDSSSISDLRKAISILTLTLVGSVNELHSSGYGTEDNASRNFFTLIDTQGSWALGNIQVNPDLTSNVNNIAAAATTTTNTAGTTTGASGDNTIANEIYNLLKDTNTETTTTGGTTTTTTVYHYKYDTAEMGLNSYYESIISWLATTGNQADANETTYDTLVDQVDTQRQATSSVSLDEEMANMVKFQNAYSANAQVLTTMDTLVASLLSMVE